MRVYYLPLPQYAYHISVIISMWIFRLTHLKFITGIKNHYKRNIFSGDSYSFSFIQYADLVQIYPSPFAHEPRIALGFRLYIHYIMLLYKQT